MQISKLPSGITLASEYISHVRTVTIGIWVRVGAANETKQELGLSHFLEHMLFKGTASRSARDIVEAFDDVGGEINAYTTKEYTCYFAKVMDEHLEIAVEILVDMLSNPLLATSDVQKEKQVVLEEICMYEDSPDELIHDYLAQEIWPKHPLGRAILGTKESIANLTQESVVEFYRRHYRPEEIVISATGNLCHDTLVELVEKLELSPHDCPRSPSVGSVVYSPKILMVERAIEQLHMCLGFPGISRINPQIYALNILNNIFGAGMSSRLFQGIREEKGLAYSIFSYPACFHDNGYFVVYAGFTSSNTEELVTTIAIELKKMRDELVSSKELYRAKQQVKGELIMGLESTTTRMSRMGRSLLLLG
ncbi:MAG: pitrilysin family protein, partial [bacterium]|nr:pitrilysin family protein [bacterium]